MKRWFITGTDTEIGKTRVTCALIRHLAGQGYRVAGMKPVASGCQSTAKGPRNDAYSCLRAQGSLRTSTEASTPGSSALLSRRPSPPVPFGAPSGSAGCSTTIIVTPHDVYLVLGPYDLKRVPDHPSRH